MASSLWSPDRTSPRLRRSQLPQRRRMELPCCDDQSTCVLASSRPRSFNFWPEFHQLDQYDNKMNICLGHTGKCALQTPREVMLQALEPLYVAEPHSPRPRSPGFATAHSQHASGVFSRMFEMPLFFHCCFPGL